MSEVLRNLVERIEPTARLADTALPPQVWRQLKEARSGVVLFLGPRGAGKTMAAHAIARELGTHLLRIDLSRLVSKYIGETEKNLDAVFDDAEQSGAVLLFDEADALFGKRSEVRDSHDRHANVEVSYLLQRIEDFDGIAILTSNLRSSIDDAFLRRLRFVVEFPPRS
jgi:SpoVK/Ycf46/Vps4 family AAA+-type ATPase